MTALAEVATEEQIISLQHRSHLRPLVVAPNVARHTVYTPPHHRLEQWTLPAEALVTRPDLLHCPDFIAPVRRPFPAVVTIHDLAFLHYPHILDDDARAFYSGVKASALRAEAVIAVSEATRQDIAQLLDIPADQIDVIHEAAAPIYGRIEIRPGEVRVLDGTPVSARTFMLFVSTLEPRKNLPTLLRALRICLDRNPAAGYQLVVAGSRGWRDEEIFNTVRDLHLEPHVIFARRVGQYDLRWLYNACRLYINPSLYEGFGLPLLEAMACGAPCLASATSSLPEIGGQAAVYVPPLEPDVWADSIAELWDDDERRAELSRLGRVQSQRFSWMRAARETLAVYRRVAEGRAAPHAPPRAAVANESELPAALLPPSEEGACRFCGDELVAGHLTQQTAVALAGSERLLILASEALVCQACGRVQVYALTEPVQPAAGRQSEPAPATGETHLLPTDTYVETLSVTAAGHPAPQAAPPLEEAAPKVPIAPAPPSNGQLFHETAGHASDVLELPPHETAAGGETAGHLQEHEVHAEGDQSPALEPSAAGAPATVETQRRKRRAAEQAVSSPTATTVVTDGQPPDTDRAPDTPAASRSRSSRRKRSRQS
ncbi:MAG: hypothetical protein RLZZ387_1466 [Chloroflexota bacterium]